MADTRKRKIQKLKKKKSSTFLTNKPLRDTHTIIFVISSSKIRTGKSRLSLVKKKKKSPLFYNFFFFFVPLVGSGHSDRLDLHLTTSSGHKVTFV